MSYFRRKPKSKQQDGDSKGEMSPNVEELLKGEMAFELVEKDDSAPE